MFRNSTSDTLAVGKFLAALRTSGIRMNDPRIQGMFVPPLYTFHSIVLIAKKNFIQEMMDNLRRVHRISNYEGGSPETQNLNRETFKS